MLVDVAARVLFNRRLSPTCNVIGLAAPEVAAGVAPGQFVMVKPSRGIEPLLRRPFSVFEILRDDRGTPSGLSLFNKRVGSTTSLLYHADEGDVVSCLGPLGRPFAPVAPPARAWMVAGGVGLAPFVTLTAALRALGTDTTLFYGARTSDELFCADLFERAGVRLAVSTEDGSRGDRGLVTAPLERALDAAPPGERVHLYVCGPTPMMRAVAALGARCGREVDVSLEQVMGCGLGGCYSCVIRVRDDEDGGHYVRSCIGGPVFDARTVVWDELTH